MTSLLEKLVLLSAHPDASEVEVRRVAHTSLHQLNNELTSILGFVELALDQTRDVEMRGDLMEIREAGRRAAALVKRLRAA